MDKVLMAEVNISEGTNLELVEKVKKSFIDEKNIEIVDIDSNVDHNRTVFTYKGEPSSPKYFPNSLAISTASSVVIFLTGINGTTSTAPILG